MKLPRIFTGVSIVLFVLLLTALLAGWWEGSPIRAAQLWTGRIAYIFLLASMTITPLRTITGNSMVIPLRKTFGLNAFYWSFGHAFVFIGFRHRFDLSRVIETVNLIKPVIPGVVAFLIIAVLAFTTLDPVKKATSRVWRKIHMWVYPANVLVLVHYSGLVSDGEIKPLPLATALYLILLFILRLKPVKMAIIHHRQR